MNAAESSPDYRRIDRLILFVAGDAPRSRRARSNLAAGLEAAGLKDAWPQEVDVLREPASALEHGMFATPALLLTRDDADATVLYGDLSDADSLRHLLASLPPE